MKNRYKKIVIENEGGMSFVVDAKEGLTLEVSEGTSGELIIKARQIETVNGTVEATVEATTDVYSTLPVIKAGEYAEELSVYIDKDGNRAIIPTGYTVSGLSEENTIWGKDVSLVIYKMSGIRCVNWKNPKEVEKIKQNYFQLVWCPVSLLDADGTLDGKNFNSKFGRRNYGNYKFSEDGFHEEFEGELLKQSKSIEKYGGFYITRYNLSEGSTKEPLSVKGDIPRVNIDFFTSISIASKIECDEYIKSHLPYGAEVDSVNAWLIKSGSKTLDEITEDSTKWGSHWHTADSPHKVVETGNREEWCANNIYDWAGNVNEWTQERHGPFSRVIRGCDASSYGEYCAVDARNNFHRYLSNNYTGIRAAFYIR